MEVKRSYQKKSSHAWTTDTEVAFLEKLGSWVPDFPRSLNRNVVPGDPTSVNRKMLLEKYLLAMYSRVEWGSIDPKIIRKTVISMIKNREREK